jgi:hypothetical protein
MELEMGEPAKSAAGKPADGKPGLHRRMMAVLGLGSVAAAAVLATATRPAAAMTPPGNKGAAKYTDSDHVKKFYRVNRY